MRKEPWLAGWLAFCHSKSVRAFVRSNCAILNSLNSIATREFVFTDLTKAYFSFKIKIEILFSK